MKSRLILIASAVLLALVPALAGSWFYVASQAEDLLNKWVEARRSKGVDIHWESLDVTGFPLRIDVTFNKGRVESDYGNRQFYWQVPPRVEARLFAIEPGAVSYSIAGRHDMRIVGPQGSADIGFEAEKFDGKLYISVREARRARKVDAHIESAKFFLNRQPSPLSIAQLNFVVERPELKAAEPAAITPQSIGFHTAFVARRISLPEGALPEALHKLLPATIGSASGDVTVFGRLDPASVSPANLLAWRDSGGVIELSDFEVEWGSISITGDGTLALDEELQPEGAFTINVAGLNELIAALEQSGLVRSRDAAIARLTLSVLARPTPGGGRATAEIPVTVQGGQILAGPVPLLRLPVIQWR